MKLMKTLTGIATVAITLSGYRLAHANARTNQPVPFTNLEVPTLNAVDFVSNTIGFVGGKGGILKTLDGGKTWRRVYAGSDVVKLDVADSTRIWAITNHELLTSTDGQTWKAHSFSANQDVQAVDVTGLTTGFIVVNGQVWHSNNNGEHFTIRSPHANVDSISFTDAKTGYASSHNSLYKTMDGGKTWNRIYQLPVQANTGDAWQGVVHAAGAHVWFMEYGGAAGMSQVAYVVFHSTNGGKSWAAVMDEGYFSSAYPNVHPQVPNAQSQMLQPGPFTVVNPDVAYFVGWNPNQGDHLVVTTNQSGHWRYESVGKTTSTDVPEFFNGPLAVSFSDAKHGWLVGGHNGKGVVRFTSNGGVTWQTVK